MTKEQEFMCNLMHALGESIVLLDNLEAAWRGLGGTGEIEEIEDLRTRYNQFQQHPVWIAIPE